MVWTLLFLLAPLQHLFDPGVGCDGAIEVALVFRGWVMHAEQFMGSAGNA
jgi:hypothetical protein